LRVYTPFPEPICGGKALNSTQSWEIMGGVCEHLVLSDAKKEHPKNIQKSLKVGHILFLDP
jgi:hypothetical protein